MFAAVENASHDLDLSIAPAVSSLISANIEADVRSGGYFLSLVLGTGFVVSFNSVYITIQNGLFQLLSNTIGASYTDAGTLIDITGLAVSEAAFGYEGFVGIKVEHFLVLFLTDIILNYSRVLTYRDV